MARRCASKPVEAVTTGGERLSSDTVAGLPLNKRDFSQLLLSAAGAQTDTNGAATFTQQFALNGQRRTAAVFAMDGIDTSNPELGGATFSNFNNVDAIEEISSESGILPPLSARRRQYDRCDYEKRKIGPTERSSSWCAMRPLTRVISLMMFCGNPDRIPSFKRNEFGHQHWSGGLVRTV
jgi:hypothetical protein